jgi:hypothetical protein
MKRIGLRGLAAPLALQFVLAGCGGGGGSDAGNVNNPPPAATLTLADDRNALAWNAAVALDVTTNDRVSAGTLSLVSVSAPAHGSASIANGKIVYTPAAGYYGSDSLTYTARADQGGTTATARVDLTVEALLTVTGTASDGPLAGATVSADVAGRASTATADASGHFELVLRSASPTDFVRLDATGSGANSPVRLRTLVGDFGALVTAAGTSARLDAGAQPRLNISHHSTAAAALAMAANGGSLPASGAQLDSAMARVSQAEALDMSALIQRVVDGGVPLPSGKVDTWSLVSDAAAYSNFLAGTVAANPAAFLAALQASRDSRPVAAPPAAEDLVGKTIVYYGTGNAPDTAYVVSFHANGSAQLRSDYGTVVCTWTRDAQRITLSFPQALVATGLSDDTDPVTNTPNEVQVSQTQLVLRRLAWAPGAYSATLVASQTYLDGSRAGQTAVLATAEQQGAVLQSIDHAQRLPIAAGELAAGTRWAGIPKTLVAAPDTLPRLTVLQDSVLLGTGGEAASLTDFNQSYRVSLADNVLSVAPVANGIEYLPIQYVRLATDAHGGERWLVMAPIVAGPPAGNGIVASLPMLPYAVPSVSAGDLVRQWQTFRDATDSMTISLFDNATAALSSVSQGGQAVQTAATWQPVEDRYEIQYGPGSAPRVRTWRPLKKVEGGLWVLESLERRLAGQDPLLMWSRVLWLEDRGPAVR